MENGFIHQDKEEFKNKLIAPILSKSTKYQKFVVKIAEQEKKWKDVEIGMTNYKEITEYIKKFDAMKSEEKIYRDITFFFLETLNQVITYLEEDILLNREKIEQLKSAKIYFDEAKFKEVDKNIKNEWIEELITNYSKKYPSDAYYSEEQKHELKTLVSFVVAKVSLLVFIEDFSTILSKEKLQKLYESLEKLFSIIPEPNLLNSMLTLIAFLFDTDKKNKLIQKVENMQKNIPLNYTFFYKTKESQLAGNALIYHVIGDFYMQENRNLDKALTYFENSLLDYQKLVAINPLEYLSLMAKAYKYMAHTYSRKENYMLSIFFYEKCLSLLKQLYRINPEKYDYDFSEHVFYMIGYYRSKIEDTEKAVEMSNYFISNYPNEGEFPYLTCYQLRTVSFLLFLEMQKAS